MKPICDCCRRPAEKLYPDHRAMAPPLSPEEGALVARLWDEEGTYTTENVQHHADGRPFSEEERRLCFQEQLECTVGGVLLCDSCYVLDYPEYWAAKAAAQAVFWDTEQGSDDL